MADSAENIVDDGMVAPSKDVDTSELTNVINELESFCVACEGQGTTRLLLTKIPYFRDVMVVSFKCPICGYANTEIQSVGDIQNKGLRIEFKVSSIEDLNRTIVKTDKCTAKFEELGLEIVPGKGQVTNVEGLVQKVVDDLSLLQEDRKVQTPEVYEQIEVVLGKLRSMAEGTTLPFTVSIDDPTGNSWVEPAPGDAPGQLIKKSYARTPELNAELGYFVQPETEGQKDAAAVQAALEAKIGVPKSVFEQAALKRIHAPLALPRDSQHVRSIGAEEGRDIEKQVHQFETTCPNCAYPCVSNMTMVDIPFFKEVILMSIVCDKCGYRNNEVKTGGAIPAFGQQMSLRVTSSLDLDRSVVKSDTCAVTSPELDFTYEPGSSGGSISTVEGILHQIRDDLHKSAYDQGDGTGGGDSLSKEAKETWDKFFARLEQAIAGDIEFTLVFKDPLAATYVERLDQAGTVEDVNLKVEDYTRTREEDDDFGLLDMKTEGYENDIAIKEEDEEAAEKAETEAEAAKAKAQT